MNITRAIAAALIIYSVVPQPCPPCLGEGAQQPPPRPVPTDGVGAEAGQDARL